MDKNSNYTNNLQKYTNIFLVFGKQKFKICPTKKGRQAILNEALNKLKINGVYRNSLLRPEISKAKLVGKNLYAINHRNISPIRIGLTPICLTSGLISIWQFLQSEDQTYPVCFPDLIVLGQVYRDLVFGIF